MSSLLRLSILAAAFLLISSSTLQAQGVDLTDLTEEEQKEERPQEGQKQEEQQQEEEKTEEIQSEEISDIEIPDVESEPAPPTQETQELPELSSLPEGETELEEIETVSPETGKKEAAWRRWEILPMAGRLFVSSSTFSDDAWAYGLVARYRFSGKGKRKDGVETELQGRHGLDLRFTSYSTDYHFEQELFSGNEALGLAITSGGKSIQLDVPRLFARAIGSYRYNIVSVNYMYTQVDPSNLKLRKRAPYALIGAGYAFGSDSIVMHMYNVDGTPNPVVDPFFTFQFESTVVLHIGGGLRWQLTPRWVANFEVLDYIYEMDDSQFLRSGLNLNDFFLDNKTIYGHNFLVNLNFGFNF